MTANARNDGGRRGLPWRIIGWGTVALLLLLPLVAGAPWTPSDYVFAAVLLGSVGLGLELAVRKGNSAYTAAAGLALGASFLLVWINGAVGIIGDEGEPANLLFLAVIALALLGVIAAMFRPAGMARAMVAAALAQALVPAIAWAASLAPTNLLLRPEVPVSTLVLTAIWLASAALFRKAAA